MAKRLSEFYGWPLYSIGDLWREEYKKQHPDGEISFEDYWKNNALEDHLRVNEVAKAIFEKGSVIGDSRYTIYCADLPALLVFITAPLDIRAQRAVNCGKYGDKTMDKIKKILLEREEDEAKIGKKLFNYDYRDPINYTLTLDSGRLTLDDEINILTYLIK